MDLELHVFGRVIAAAALGALIGLEREAADQPAGLRTHMTVAMGAALFGVISTLGFDEFQTTQRSTNIQFDVTRVASTVVTGIGFLGAGLIFRRGTTVHNLTTAASVWVVAAVGLACGVGDIGPAVMTSAILVAGLVVLRLPRQWLRDRFTHDQQSVRVVLHRGRSEVGVMEFLRSVPGVSVERIGLEKQDSAMVVVAEMRADPSATLQERLSDVARREDVATLIVGDPLSVG
jgi:putative Mg2+ transporter-C (MgtC) family protein